MKQPNKSVSSTIIFKTPTMKYYDKGFIYYYDDHVQLQLLNVGTIVLDLLVYPTEICKSAFECINSKEFNKKYLHESYNNSFLYNLFNSRTIYHKDKKNKILIKVK